MEFLQQILGLFVDLVRQFTWRDAVDVLAVSFIIYSGIKLVRESRAEQLVKGLLLVVVIFGLANYLQLYMLKGLLSTFFQFTIVALLIVFQPELRRALEQMGRNGVSKPFTLAAYFYCAWRIFVRLDRHDRRKLPKAAGRRRLHPGTQGLGAEK